jgi:tRNA G18 (ribose-2'-O)-methylase SpoU
VAKFGIGIINPKVKENVGTLWRSAYLFNANFIFTVGRRYTHQCTDTPKTSRHIPLFTWDKIEIPDGFCPIIIEKTDTSQNFLGFKHPKNAIYILGSESSGIPKDLLKKEWSQIHIETEKPQSMNVAVAGSIIMCHRHGQTEC